MNESYSDPVKEEVYEENVSHEDHMPSSETHDTSIIDGEEGHYGAQLQSHPPGEGDHAAADQPAPPITEAVIEALAGPSSLHGVRIWTRRPKGLKCQMYLIFSL